MCADSDTHECQVHITLWDGRPVGYCGTVLRPLGNKVTYTEVGEVEVMDGFLSIRAFGAYQHNHAQQWHKSISDPTILDGAVDEINRIIAFYQPSTTQTYWSNARKLLGI